MKAVEKETLYNLLKTVSVAVNGYTSKKFNTTHPIFTDDPEQQSQVQSQQTQVRQSQQSQQSQTQVSSPANSTQKIKNTLVLVIVDSTYQENDKQTQLLDKMLSAICLSKKQNCDIIDISKNLDEQIATLKPKMLLIMGERPSQTIYQTSVGINSLRGNFYNYHGLPAMATYSTSTLLQNESLKAFAWQDLKKFRFQLEKIEANYAQNFIKE